MEPITLKATLRSDRGKGAARRLRRAEQIPAVAYGKGGEALALSVSPKALRDVLMGKYGTNAVIKLEVEGGETLHSLVAEYQYHPVSRALLHADFRRIDINDAVDFEVPFELKGRSKGVVLGGELRQIYRKLPVRCLPALVPEKITHDITELGLEESVTVKDVVVPEGVSVRMAETRTVAAVAAGRKAKVEETETKA